MDIYQDEKSPYLGRIADPLIGVKVDKIQGISVDPLKLARPLVYGLVNQLSRYLQV